MPTIPSSSLWPGAGSIDGSAFGIPALSPATRSGALSGFQSFGGGATQSAIKPFGGSQTMAAIGNMLTQSTMNQYGNLFGGAGAAQSGQGSGMSSLGGDWSGVDQWDSQIGAAAAKYGVPANLIKAVMKLESGGQNQAMNGAGAVGPMQVVGSIWGGLGYDLSQPDQNIMAGAAILKQNYDQYQSWALQNGIDPWKAAVEAYYAGNPYDLSAHDSTAQGGSGMSTGQYGDQVWSDYQNLNAFGLGGSGTVANSMNVSGSTGGFSSVLGSNGNAPISQDFNVPSDLGLYSYSTEYGLNGINHTGVDIAVPYGTPYFAPMGGTVLCAGTGVGQDESGGSCAAFRDLMGNGAGRVEIQLDNGAVLIYGHSSRAALAPGSRVSAGTLLGYSGGENGAHVHLEARVRDPSTDSGWRIVDPRTILGGGFAGAPSTGQANPNAITNSYYLNWAQNRGRF